MKKLLGIALAIIIVTSAMSTDIYAQMTPAERAHMATLESKIDRILLAVGGQAGPEQRMVQVNPSVARNEVAYAPTARAKMELGLRGSFALNDEPQVVIQEVLPPAPVAVEHVPSPSDGGVHRPAWFFELYGLGENMDHIANEGGAMVVQTYAKSSIALSCKYVRINGHVHQGTVLYDCHGRQVPGYTFTFTQPGVYHIGG